MQAKGLDYRHTDNVNFWLASLNKLGLPRVSMNYILVNGSHNLMHASCSLEIYSNKKIIKSLKNYRDTLFLGATHCF